MLYLHCLFIFSVLGMPTLLALMLLASNVTKAPDASATVENFATITVPMYSDDDFHAHFRMRRSTFQVSLAPLFLKQLIAVIGQVCYNCNCTSCLVPLTQPCFDCWCYKNPIHYAE